MRKGVICILIILGTGKMLFGQWECPSQLGGSLKPLGNSKLLWGTEITAAAGYLTNNSIYNTMGLLGIDYTSNQHTFYFEGGFKYWYRNDYDLDVDYHNEHFGMRELYYQNQSKLGTLTLGLQSMRSDDNYLLNERVLGLNYKKSFSRFDLNLFVGTVSKDFSRNGTFCSVSYLYDILPYQNRTLIGNSLWQTNMAGFTIGYHPSAASGNSVISDDGLGLTDESTSHSFFHIETIGLAFYSEFGDWVPETNVLSGLYSNAEIGNDFWLKPELLYQESSDNKAIIYCAKAEKAFTWVNTHRTSLEAAYFGFVAINKNAQMVNLFSNIFAGSVLRLDSPDLPFYQIAVKYAIPNAKAHLKLQYASEAEYDPAHELDIELGKKFFGKLLINGTYGYIKSPLLTDDPNLFRVEIRLDI